MHSQPQGAAQQPTRPCRYCGTPFIARRRWQAFCSPQHRNAFHAQAAHQDADQKLALVRATLRYVGREVGGEIGTDIEAMDPKAVLAAVSAGTRHDT